MIDTFAPRRTATLDKQRAKIIIPTPALCEVLIGAADAAPAYLEILSRHALLRSLPSGCGRQLKPLRVIAKQWGAVIKRRVRRIGQK
jgi:hypothetical protein